MLVSQVAYSMRFSHQNAVYIYLSSSMNPETTLI
jgi:hypothetical protein